MFSYQAIVSSYSEAERTSWSPSPSRSAAYTDVGLLASEMLFRSEDDPPPVVSYQAILPSLKEAERTSWSPSPSRSAAYTDSDPSALPVIVFWADEDPPLVF